MPEEQYEAPQTYTCRSPFMTCNLPSGNSICFKNGVYKAETQGEVNDFENFLSVQKPVHRSKYNRVDYRHAAQVAAEYLKNQGPAAAHGVSTTAHRPHAANTVNELMGRAHDAEAAAREIAAVAGGADPSTVAQTLPDDPNLPATDAPLSEPATEVPQAAAVKPAFKFS